MKVGIGPEDVTLKNALVVLAVLLTTSCGYFDDRFTVEIPPAATAAPLIAGEGAQVWVAEDRRRIEITAAGGACDESVEIRVSEGARKVRIVVRVTSNDGPCVSVALSRTFRVGLKEPLGDRDIVGGNGRSYPRSTDRPRTYSSDSDIPVRVVHED
ncbi:hypothetical protein [Thermomonospora umbrina]|uniref:Lipoprotein n=1 Tax=Thermomonospora umbrina TaxID=111806 RepID=A0A3D9T803_9ACTN|nr:hypothetical protein [Thermomonospora umbrina]REE99901.1 hypothetical protein DFJ69_5418 [Thermomonospora umbrina]